MSTAKVLIGIQARLNNTRLPGKCRELIGGKPMLERVITAAIKSARHMNTDPRSNIKAEVALLVPKGDPLGDEYRVFCPVVEGPEDDVLTRYHMALTTFAPDYMVRLTSDCPLIPPFVITNHVTKAVKNQMDYVYNCDPDIRMHPDGWDTEVISHRLLKWLNEHAHTKYDREHVTSLIHKEQPDWAVIKPVLGYTDNHHLKLSVDTQEDLDYVRIYFDVMNKKINKAEGKFGGMFRL